MNTTSDNPLQVNANCNGALLFNIQQEFVLSRLFPDSSYRHTTPAIGALALGGGAR